MAFSNELIFYGALLIAASILASAFSARFGAPILLVFLVLGMLAGEDGPGGFKFNNFELAYLASTLALAVILFDGGMRTRAESFRVALRPAVSLATIGVLVTAAITGVAATWAFGLNWMQGLLLGAIVGSTDAAAGWIAGRALVWLINHLSLETGLYPLLAGLEHGYVYFNAAFIVVLLSLLLQGWTIAPLARALDLEVPPRARPLQHIDLDIPGQFDHDLLGYRLEADSIAAGKPPAQLPLPPDVEVAAVIRGTRVMKLDGIGPLQPGDYVYLLADPPHADALNRLFGVAHGPARLDEHRFFGDFVLNGDARIADIEAVYGLGFPDRDPEETLAAYLNRRFRGKPVVGDRLRVDGVALAVREVERGLVTRVGLKLHD